MCGACGLQVFFPPYEMQAVAEPLGKTSTQVSLVTEKQTEHNTKLEETKMETQQTSANWMDEEISAAKLPTGDKVDGLKFEENKITEFTVDFSKKFEKKDTVFAGKSSLKAIIPVTQNGKKLNLWLNVKNPLYAQILVEGKKGVTNFKVMRTGSATDTKYILVQ